MKKNLLVYGAGAIGRGYMPWVYSPAHFDYLFVERNANLRDELKSRKKYTTFRTVGGRYESRTVPVAAVFAPGEERDAIAKADAIVTAVGPRNLLSLQEMLLATQIPVICCENDSTGPERLRAATGNPSVVFGVPDVITSNTAPAELLEKDPLAIVTEDGVCIVDEAVSKLGGNCKYVHRAELAKQWLAKLYIHNTPHCIAAYLGALVGATYLHEAMATREIERLVNQAMLEMQQMLLHKYKLDAAFLSWYAEKELSRFKNTLLYDPISRVAREPFRKLGHKDRLIGAAELCLSSGILPEALALGVMAAFCYENPADPDSNIVYLMRALAPQDFLKMIIKLREDEALFEMLLERWEKSLATLRGLKS